MNFTEFVTWVKAQKIDAAVKHEILYADIDDPNAYVANMRRLIKILIDKKTRITGVTYANYYKKLDQIYQDLLSPAFLESIPTAIAIKKAQHRRENAKHHVIEVLSDPVKLNAAIRGRDVINLPVGSDYANRDNYLGYLLSKDFKPTEMNRKNPGRVLGFLQQAFGEQEAVAAGLKDGIFDTSDNVELSRFAIILEAALYAVQAAYMDEDQAENIAIHDREDLTDQVFGLDPEAHPGQKQQLRRAMQSSWHPISLDGVLKGHLDELSSQLGSIISAYPAIIQCYKALARLQTMQAGAGTQQEQRDLNVGTVKDMIVKIPFVGYQPHELVNAYNILTDRCDSCYQKITALKEKDAKVAMEELLKSLQQLREIVKNAKVVDGKPVFFANDQEELRANIVMNYKKLADIVALLLPPSGGGDDLMPIYISIITSLSEKYSDLISDKDLFPLLSDNELGYALFSTDRKDLDELVTQGVALTAEQQAKASELFEAAGYAYRTFTETLCAVRTVRAAWLINSTQGEINVDDITLSDATILYDYCFGVLQDEAERIVKAASSNEEKEILTSHLNDTLDQFRAKLKALEQGGDKENKQLWVDLAKEASVINLAEIAQQALHAEQERKRDEAQAALSGEESDDDSKGKEELSATKQNLDTSKAAAKREPDVSRVDVTDDDDSYESEATAQVDDDANDDAGEESEATAQMEGGGADDDEPEHGEAPIQPGMVVVSDDEDKKHLAKIAELTTVCDDYMKYLGRLIYEGIRDYDYELLKKNDKFQLLYRPDENSRIQFKIARVFDDANINGPQESAVREEIKRRVEAIGNRDEKYKLLVDKYAAMRTMRATLTDPAKNAEQKLQAFKQSFDANRPLIEKRRDSKEMVFIKRLITVLTAGIAYLAGMWKIKGKEFSGEVDDKLSGDNKQKKPR